jgi:prephenate dehydrogenase
MFQRVAILGTGLMGGSFALALRAAVPQVRIIGWDLPDVLPRAATAGCIDEGTPDLAAAVRDADLIYVALPLGAALEHLPVVARSASADGLVTDVCGTKLVIERAAEKFFTRGGARFLGGHPMAGKEGKGLANADAGIFRGSKYVLIAGESDPDPRVQRFAALVRAIGAEPLWMDAETHDWAAGIVSHLPQLVSVALASVVRDETDETGLPLTLAGPGLRDSLRLAGSPHSTWRDVCLTNTDNISRALDRVSQAIDHLRQNLRTRELKEQFDAANELYKTLREMK